VRQSWRANDFLWGRLDGAARLVDLLLAPSRLQRSPVAYETMEAIPGLRLPLPEKKGTFLDPADHGELEAWRACLQDSLALGILGTELENVSISMGSDTDEHEFSPEGDLVAALRAGDLETRFAAYARALAESAPDTIKTRVMDERNSDGGARLAVRTLDVGVSYLEAEGGPLKLAGRLLDAPVHVIGGLVAVRAEAHRIWRVIREHMPSNDSTTP
jgi:hypothetical protein